MRRDLIDILACPVDKAPLELVIEQEVDGDVVSGRLTCPRCARVYPISASIPNLLPHSG